MSADAAIVGRPVQVYEPYRSGLPPLVPYVKNLWRRRHFAIELSRASMRAAHTDTVFGQLWLVINPLLNACVYFLLVNIINGGTRGPDFFIHLIAGLFVFNFLQNSLTQGAESVTKGGKLVLNTSFPLLLLPYATMRTSFYRFLPSMGIYVVLFAGLEYFGPRTQKCNAAGACVDLNTLHFSWIQLLAIPVFAFIWLYVAGLTTFMAALTVYFRDTTQFLPYATRIWLYLSPVLYYADQMKPWMTKFEMFNPLYPILGLWGDVIARGQLPHASWWIATVAWGLGSFAAGTLYFLSRERDFAVRL